MIEPLDLRTLLPNQPLPEKLSAAEFAQAAVVQLAKDFQWDLEKINQRKISILQLLEDEIQWGFERNPTGLFAAFYRLDLGEPLIRKILEENERPDAIKLLALKSLQRACLKVWTRYQYS